MEISPRATDENLDSENAVIFRGLRNFAAKLDSDLGKHLESSTVFKKQRCTTLRYCRQHYVNFYDYGRQ